MTLEHPARPVAGNVSPYLLHPLRTLEKAQQDRNLHQRSIVDAEVKRN